MSMTGRGFFGGFSPISISLSEYFKVENTFSSASSLLLPRLQPNWLQFYTEWKNIDEVRGDPADLFTKNSKTER